RGDNRAVPAGIAGLRAGTKDASGNWLITTTTASDGPYALKLSPGTYTIYAETASGYQAAAPVAGVVVSTGVTIPNVNFIESRWAFLTGTLVDTAGAAVGGLDVIAYDGACCPTLRYR